MNKLLQPTTHNLLLRIVAGLLPTYIVRFSVFYIPTNLFEVLVACALVYGVCLPEVRRSWRDGFFSIPRAIKIWAGLFLLSAIVSIFISEVPRVSWGILKGWVVIPMLFGFLVHSAIQASPIMRKRIIDSLLCSGVVVALLGIAQIGTYDRVRALYDVPNSLALFLVPLAVIAVWVGYTKNSRVYQLSASVIGIAILATQSAGAIIALVVTFLLFVMPDLPTGQAGLLRHLGALLGARNSRLFYGGVIFFIAFSVFFISSGRLTYLLSPLIRPGTTNSVTVRLQLWDLGTRLILKHPIVGIGLGQFEPAYQTELHSLFAQQSKEASEANAAKVSKLQPEFVVRDPHNWIISFWLNAGILGLASFILLNYLAIRKLRNAQIEKDIYAQAIIFAILSILIFGLLDTVYWKNDLSALWWIFLLLI